MTQDKPTSPFMTPDEFRERYTITMADGTKILPHELKAGKWKQSNRVAPVIGQRRRK